MPDREDLPGWAGRLRDERLRRLWSQKVMAVRLRDAADKDTRAVLPDIESIRRYVRDYESGRHRPGDLYAELYCRAFGLAYDALFGRANRSLCRDGPTSLSGMDAANLLAWINVSNVSDDAVMQLSESAHLYAEMHTSRAPLLLLEDVTGIHKQLQAILRAGKQRLRQTRELYRIDTDVLAHASLLLGDLDLNDAAAALGETAMQFADEIDANKAIVFSVRAKTERWRHRFADSAELARHGYDCSPPTHVRVLLASQEAHGAALDGDVRRAYEALRRAESARDKASSEDSGVSAWSFPRPRQAMFALAVAIRAGDADGALQFVRAADDAWSSGDPKAVGTWAQVRLGGTIAYIMKGDLEAACLEFTPVLSLPPEFRMSTITGYTAEIDKRLQQRKFATSDPATRMRDQIREFEASGRSALSPKRG
jgi:hypothetical protein